MNNLKITETSKLLNVSISTLKIWDLNGKLKGLRDGCGRRYYTKEMIDKFLIDNPEYNKNIKGKEIKIEKIDVLLYSSKKEKIIDLKKLCNVKSSDYKVFNINSISDVFIFGYHLYNKEINNIFIYNEETVKLTDFDINNFKNICKDCNCSIIYLEEDIV